MIKGYSGGIFASIIAIFVISFTGLLILLVDNGKSIFLSLFKAQNVGFFPGYIEVSNRKILSNQIEDVIHLVSSRRHYEWQRVSECYQITLRSPIVGIGERNVIFQCILSGSKGEMIYDTNLSQY